MTPAQLDELKSAWPGEWHLAHIVGPRQYRLGGSWLAEWSIYAYENGGTYCLEAESNDRDPTTVRGTGPTFADAKTALSDAIAYHTEQLATLSRMVP